MFVIYDTKSKRYVRGFRDDRGSACINWDQGLMLAFPAEQALSTLRILQVENLNNFLLVPYRRPDDGSWPWPCDDNIYHNEARPLIGLVQV